MLLEQTANNSSGYRWRTLLVLLLSALALSAALLTRPAAAVGYLVPEPAQRVTSLNILRQLEKYHYQKIVLDDRQSSKILDRYLEAMDRDRLYFLASDIAEFEALRYQLDEALLKGDLKPAYQIFNRYQQRRLERLDFVIAMLAGDLSSIRFDTDEKYQIDRETAPWATTSDALDQLWRQRLKNGLLSLKLAGKETPEAGELLTKRYQSQRKRVAQVNSGDVFQTYMNAFTRSYDPHTAYLPPRQSENFNINMRLSLEGIGALLRSEYEHTKVVSLIKAGPAEKAGELQPADRIVGVAQGDDGEIVDVVGWRLDEVVDLIRGAKGTVVKLRVIPADAEDDFSTRDLRIVRDTVRLEEQAAQKELLEFQQDEHSYRVGVITVPAFYIDFRAYSAGDPNYRSTTRDVRKLLAELMEDRIDGLVIDLRGNGGGALKEATELTGLFIKTGPTVQVRYADNQVSVERDRDAAVTYSGPVAVLVDRMSASASEIFAGAIQDYGRGMVLGERTFGKGTVQKLSRVDRGQIKLTHAKFYRISGLSTQHDGVLPDIAYPSLYDHEEIGESALDDALPGDRIKPTRHSSYGAFASYLPQLKMRHELRVQADPDFRYLEAQQAFLDRNRARKHVSLNEKARRSEREALEAERLQLVNTRRKAKGLSLLKKLEDAADEAEKDKEVDGVLLETGRVLADLIQLRQGQLAQHRR